MFPAINLHLERFFRCHVGLPQGTFNLCVTVPVHCDGLPSDPRLAETSEPQNSTIPSVDMEGQRAVPWAPHATGHHGLQIGDMAVCQNLVPLVNIKIAGKWMFIPLKMLLIGIDPYPYSVTMVIIVITLW